MAKQTTIDEKEVIPVPGAEGNSENKSAESQNQEQANVLLEAQDPQWVQVILDSNQAVIDSNQAVSDSIESFRESANELIQQIGIALPSSEVQYAPSVKVQEIDEDAAYEVAEGKSFRDSNDFSKEYKSGDDVTDLGAQRLQVLLNQGLIVES